MPTHGRDARRPARVPDDAVDDQARVALSDLPPDPHRLPPPGAWFAPDAERHLLDRPKFCPMCAASIEIHGGISTEDWMGDQRVFMTWCGECGWFGDVVRYEMVTITEEEH